MRYSRPLRASCLLPIAATVCAALLSVGCARDDEAADDTESVSDEAVIENLRDAGSDLSKQHEVDFNLYFPNEAAAKRFAGKLSDKPFKVEIAEGDDEWSVQATRKMALSAADIKATSEELTALAETEGGELDGWGAAVTY